MAIIYLCSAHEIREPSREIQEILQYSPSGCCRSEVLFHDGGYWLRRKGR